jgi:hypothetical protein
MKIRPAGTELFLVDGHDEANSHFLHAEKLSVVLPRISDGVLYCTY